jgi:hypothetical protein
MPYLKPLAPTLVVSGNKNVSHDRRFNDKTPSSLHFQALSRREEAENRLKTGKTTS